MTKPQLYQLINNLGVIERKIGNIKGLVSYIDYVWDEDKEQSPYPNEEFDTLKYEFKELSNYVLQVADADFVDDRIVESKKELPRLTEEIIELIPEAR